MGTLTVAGVKAISEPGRYIDGDGLMLRVAESGSKNWILRVRIEGERRDVGLGSFKVVPLAEAQEKARESREYCRLIAQGVDPVAEKKDVVDPVPTFRDAVTRVHADHKTAWKNGKHQAQWIIMLETYAFPTIDDRPVDKIEGPLIRDVLAPIWLTKPKTARRVRQRIDAMLDCFHERRVRRFSRPSLANRRWQPRRCGTRSSG